ncbi:flagellar basal body rod modification protein [Mesorhizobium sp. SEMIA 3007]|jgi:flagellar basal-body rod modification protein FlgD|uniref:Basal-body rod modification protein FlgD n=1 Tax=Mesorhizobium jarvisii TaxID=1777867 RepID=A0A6M7TD57_9HYPH|nr:MULTISPECIES: flagellar hook assembly protein FlgD [Mesorhizobium]AID32268.1 flagellar hook assembly protein FlgD [Mesorhizobium huakuii 7653R]ANN57080.1 flagellar basal body rod modification protein [Mesorhizobium loti NZP2037]MCH4555258.1 flagellar hook assembly protein FlgD [Mesorhizobium jarvisii]OBQ75991.1 flagellar basal body rod modification protein [Mesorhizobium loti]ODA96965.1 flagellar basal body rod modification protein [Mesorhizobium sp. SEMIA 3007]
MTVDMTTTIPVGANSTTTSTSKTAVDYQSFLKLLIAEMKNQDPTKPMDSTQYVAQLATFSQVEQSVQTNTKLDQIMQSSALSQADAIIGRSITSADGKTTGTVASVTLASSGLIAVLQDGTKVPVGPGVSIKPAS